MALRCMQRLNQHRLKWECQEDLFRQDVQDAGDMRLSISLLRMCMADKNLYCSHVEFGARSRIAFRFRRACLRQCGML